LQNKNVNQKEWNLIASENYQSPAVLEAQSSHFANKYSEGTPGEDIMEDKKIQTK
jgi:glycine/serine hydroxymethyltransferase